MKISKLIEELTECQKQCGDLSVVVFVPRKYNKTAELNFLCPMNFANEPATILLLAHTQGG